MQHSDLKTGIRKGLPFVLPTLALGISFGVLAEPVMGQVAPIVMSMVVFAGAAQFASLSVLAAAGGAGAAILAGLLMNARFLPMGFAIAPSLKGRRSSARLRGRRWWTRRGRSRTAPTGRSTAACCWARRSRRRSAGWAAPRSAYSPDRCSPTRRSSASTRSSRRSTSPLLAEEGGTRTGLAVALIGAAITLSLMSFVPAGLAVIAASVAALIGLRGTRE